MKKRFHLLLGLILILFSAVTFAQMVDINTATADQLEKGLKGIGPSKAAAIVKYRQEHGRFNSVEELTNVPGIGDKTLAGIKDSVTVGSGTPSIPATPGKSTLPAKPT
ncbi:MAG: helix-hairpin-helix domain-containing protein, partial [Candidatus Competibacter sp.]|nr:helix-hairpin-helix domain-containing protein [Candidatus Competibacter sp.]